MRTVLTEARATTFARIALRHVEREYPNKLDHVLHGPADAVGPRALHPVFFGSLDWHSCVHGCWTLARLLRRFPAMAPAGDVRALFDRRLTPDAVGGELAYLARPSSRGFERPYGRAWLLKLAAKLSGFDAPADACWRPSPTPSRTGSWPSCRAPPVRSAPARISTPPSRWPWRATTRSRSATTSLSASRGGRPSTGTGATAAAKPGSVAGTSSCRSPWPSSPRASRPRCSAPQRSATARTAGSRTSTG